MSNTIGADGTDLVVEAKKHGEILHTSTTDVDVRLRMDDEKYAIRVENAYKRYSSKLPFVLDELCMNVQKSTIYSLLGASGCGKTTLLSCITGQKVLDAGNIHLSIRSKKQLGFMPQQVSLYAEFTIEEMLCYYGLIYGMSLLRIREQGKYLQQLLHLNHFQRTCGSLSGGQQRRVSLAIALMHDPDLLILDEPTSGIDTVIADEIWIHLLKLANNGRTILITTHYIDEAKRSHMIGLLRKGVLMEESPPQDLLQKYNMQSLEDVFLLLSTKQQQDRIQCWRECDAHENFKGQSLQVKKQDLAKKGQRTLQSKEFFRGSRLRAQIWKHLLWMKGNPGVMVFMAVVPMFSVLFFNYAIGHIPRQMHLGVVNHETTLNLCDTLSLPRNCTEFEEQPFSCIFLNTLSEHHIQTFEFRNAASAQLAAKENRIWGVLTFPANFTTSMQLRMVSPMNMPPEDVDSSEIGVQLDKSDFIISNAIMRALGWTFRDSILHYTTVCNFDPKLSHLPPLEHSYLYGTLTTSYNQFTGPAILILVIFYMPFLFTTSALIMEKSKGIIERSMIAGMTLLEIITSHMVVQFILLIFQIIFSLVIHYRVFVHPLVGNPLLVFALLFMVGLCGTFYGLVTALTCNSDGPAGLIVIGTSIPFIFLSGFIWPVQSIEPYTRYLASVLPLTYPIEAFRSIVFRGFNFRHWTVYYGFLACSGWVVGLGIVCWLLLRYKKGLV